MKQEKWIRIKNEASEKNQPLSKKASKEGDCDVGSKKLGKLKAVKQFKILDEKNSIVSPFFFNIQNTIVQV